MVDDQLFIETAEKLEQNLKVLLWFLAPFFALVIVLVTLVTFLLLRSTRRDMAISLSLGRPKILSGCACFFGMLIANVCGCAVAVPILLCTAGDVYKRQVQSRVNAVRFYSVMDYTIYDTATTLTWEENPDCAAAAHSVIEALQTRLSE